MYSKALLLALLLLSVIALSCRKESNKESKPFLIVRAEGKTVIMDSIVFFKDYFPMRTGALYYLNAYSTKNRSAMWLHFRDRNDTTVVGEYLFNRDIMLNQIRDVSIYLEYGPTVEDRLYCYLPADGLKITITGQRNNRLQGSMRGNVVGGYPAPGGFTISFVNNVRLIPVQIDFDPKF